MSLFRRRRTEIFVPEMTASPDSVELRFFNSNINANTQNEEDGPGPPDNTWDAADVVQTCTGSGALIPIHTISP